MQDLGSSSFFTEGKAKMITVSGTVEQEFYNNRPSYKGMLFLSIQARNQTGQGFSKDTKMSAKLEIGEAGRLSCQVNNLVSGVGAGFKKAYQTEQTNFDFTISAGPQGFQIVLTKNQLQQGSALTEDEMLEIASYVAIKANAVEQMVSAFEANSIQFSGQERNNGQQGGGYQQGGNQGGGYNPQGGGYNPQGGAPAGAPQGGGYGAPQGGAPQGGGYGAPQGGGAPAYTGTTPNY